MYRIRSASGTEAVYSSLEEFNAAVRRGEVAAEDEIFHTRANRWLDVKSHPHYRSALSWSGSGDGGGVGAAASHRPAPAAAAPRAAQSAPQAQGSQLRPQQAVSERPVLRPPQTVLRPQLVADAPQTVQTAAPPAPSPAPASPPRKSKELAFIDLGTPATPAASQRNATVIEARKPAAPPSGSPSNPAPASNAPGTEVDFLVMDGGIESPVRTSAGHRAIPEDLDLLFDRSLHPEKALAGRSAVADAPTPTKPQPETASAPKAQVEAPAAPRKKLEPPVVVTPKVEAPKAEPPKIRSPKSGPVPAIVETAPPSHLSKPAMPAIATAAHDDLTIPGGALLAEPAHAVMPAAAAARPGAGGSKSVMAMAGVAVVVIVAGLLAWKPWHGRGPSEISGTQSTPSSSPVVAEAPPPSTPTVSAQAPTTTVPGKATLAAATPPVLPGAPKPAELAARTDTAAAKSPDDQIVAATRPNFRADAAVPSADLGLGSDIHAAGGGGAAVAPSELTRRLEAAEKQAQQDLVAKMGGFRSLLAPNHLASSDGISAARTAWTSGGESIRQYRARIARLESAYQDSVLGSQRTQRWSSDEMRAWAGHQSAAEPVETSQLTDLMFSQVNEGLDILAALQGQYDIKGSNIAFKNPASGTRYLSIRTWVEQRMQAWAATPESARPYSVAAILRALGEGFPAPR